MQSVGLDMLGIKNHADLIGTDYLNLVSEQDKSRIQALLSNNIAISLATPWTSFLPIIRKSTNIRTIIA